MSHLCPDCKRECDCDCTDTDDCIHFCLRDECREYRETGSELKIIGSDYEPEYGGEGGVE